MDWLFERAKSTVELYLQRDTPDFIGTASGPIALGAMEAVMEVGLKPGRDIKFAGVGWFQDVLDAVENGQMTLTYGGYFISGAWARTVLRDDADNIRHENAGEIEAPLFGVDEESITEFQHLVGVLDWTDVDFSSFLRTRTGKSRYDFSRSAIFAAIQDGGV